MNQKEGRVRSYCDAVNYLLEKYVTDDVIAKPEVDMMRFIQLSNKFATEYAEELWNKALQWDIL